ncbi:bifunctional diguanylate cyclase/phosphodiesterase [Glaciecola sp. MH2013]|uniref:putative bifunctional diguanylate cyclase/phosphodiesterase n=1 Tax=Glaciecola sp. MH2013 TaxID=2785524 RepID=UPI00189E297B|nr:bifunctional diguanylate cyclase/phosphodiesterase [Glaciecola sp. MH2013]MBF7073768.1 bifunctional diguanylate cyclase/phosphodiesterase [Glaciecola sp. MH2013]
MMQIRGLLSKTLVMVTLVAIVSLAASYGFVTAQQAKRFSEQINEIKFRHTRTTNLLLNKQLEEQILASQELIALGSLNTMSPQQGRLYFQETWARIRTSYNLSGLALSEGKQTFQLGNFPKKQLIAQQQEALINLSPQSSIVCHLECELSSTVPLAFNSQQWALTLVGDLAPAIEHLHQIIGSDIGILLPNQLAVNDDLSLLRYPTELLTSAAALDPLRRQELSLSQLEQLEEQGLELDTNNGIFFIWFDQIDSVGYPLKLIFIRDITSLIAQQTQQKQQIIIIFVAVTLGILLTLITFSIIPISQINKLRRATKLIANKEYNTARFRIGRVRKRRFGDELYELEEEFVNAIDMLEGYEHELDVSQKRLLRQATIDSTTGLYTRNVLVEDLQRIKLKKTAHNVALFFLDLDGFKPVNDNLGHEAGDIMLKKIGYRLKGVSNKHIRVYRIGGDEFVIGFSNYEKHDDLVSMADSVVQLFAAPFHIYETNITISASIGIAVEDAENIDADQLLRFADIAMYQAKEGGKNRYRFFDESMHAQVQLRFTIKNDFVSALAEGQLFLVYQPIVDSQTRIVTKLEALCRWRHPELGFIAPPTFIDVLEESENMNLLFEWIVVNVITEVLYLDSVGKNDIVISVNLSPSQLGNDRAIEYLEEKLKEHRVHPSRIELEITETTLVANFNQAKKWIENATELGFRVAIDDFGAGYSSLSYLTAFNYNTVKLDRSLLDKIDVDDRQQRIVGSLTQMIHSLSVPIVAEGAETEEQFAKLKSLGCDYIQGYLISKPIEHERLVDYLDNEAANLANLPAI